MLRLVTLIAAAPGGDSGDIRKGIAEAASAATADLGDLGEVRHAFASDVPRRTGSLLTSTGPTIAGMLEVLMPEEHLGAVVGSLSGLADRLGEPINPSQSVVVVGREHLVLPGMGALQIHMALRRNPALTHDEFLSCWQNEFAPMVVANEPHCRGYRQVHPLSDESEEASQALGLPFDDFDGVAVEWFPSADLLDETAATMSAMPEFTALCQQFVDDANSRPLVSDNALL